MKIRKNKPFQGLTTAIRKAPISAPITAPYIGMSAMAPVSADIAGAYGKRKISIPAKQRRPIIIASVTCAIMNLENET